MATTRLLLPRPVVCARPYCSSYSSQYLSSWMKNSEDELKGKKSSSPFSLVLMRKEKMTSTPHAVVQTSPLVSYKNNEAVDLPSIWANLVAAVVSVARFAQIRKPTPTEAQLFIETGLIDCRFFTIMAVAGSLLGAILCYVEGCSMIFKSYLQYFYAISQRMDLGFIVQLLIEAIDMFLIGTAMVTFSMGLYVMFVVGSKSTERSEPQLPQSSLFGLFHLKMIPPWAETQSMSHAKSSIGHAVMMVLQVGILEKFKRIPLVTALDLACFAGALMVSSASIFVLSKLYTSKLIR